MVLTKLSSAMKFLNRHKTETTLIAGDCLPKECSRTAMYQEPSRRVAKCSKMARHNHRFTTGTVPRTSTSWYQFCTGTTRVPLQNTCTMLMSVVLVRPARCCPVTLLVQDKVYGRYDTARAVSLFTRDTLKEHRCSSMHVFLSAQHNTKTSYLSHRHSGCCYQNKIQGPTPLCCTRLDLCCK